MDEKPGFIKRQLMKVDMGIFYWTMCTFRAGITLIDILLDHILGYTIQHGSREERSKSEEYEYSAQVVNLLGRGTYSPIQPHQLNNFVWQHDKYVHPKYVLDHDNITLMGVTPSQVFFCVSEPNLNIYETKLAPFLFIGQFLKAKKLVIMCHSSFNRLGAEIGDPNNLKMTFVNMTARCGSTLLSQMISRTPKSRTMSEPWCLVHLHGHLNQRLLSMAEYKRLLRNLVRLLCKPEKNHDIEHIFIKTTMLMSPAFPKLKEMFPKAIYIFNTRRFKESLESSMQVFTKGLPSLFNYSGAFFKLFWGHQPIPYDDPFFHNLQREWKYRKMEFQAQGMAFRFSAQISSFLRHRDDYDMIVLYEDIITDPEDVCKKLLKVCGVPLEYVPKAMEALKTDSQMGTFGKRGDKPRASQSALDHADKVFAECGLPIKSDMEVEEFRKLIVSGTYSMKSEHDWPSRDYKKIQGLEKYLLDIVGIRVLSFL